MANQKDSLGNTGKKGEVLWKKTRGTLRLVRDGTPTEPITSGMTIWAKPEEIPETFRDTVVPVDALELSNVLNPPLEYVDPTYSIVPRGTPGRFDIVDSRGKAINEKALTEAEAKKRLEALLA